MASAASVTVEAAANFSRDFFKALGSCVPGNVVASPLGALSALAFAQMGARGETQREMVRSLQLPADSPLLRADFRDLFQGSIQQGVLEVATAMYIGEEYVISPRFLQAVSAATLPSSVEPIDFLDDTAPDTINSWVDESTQGKIKSIVSNKGSDFDAFTRLAVMSTMWLRATWSRRFNPNNTTVGSFFVDKRHTVQVHFMRECLSVRLARLEHLDAQLIELPYKGGELSLLVLVPNKRDGLAKLERKMRAEDLSTLLSQAQPRNVCLCLPRFRLESRLDLEKPLKQLGMRRVFSQKEADFTGISGGEPRLHLHEVLQTTAIDVTEAGTEPPTGANLTLRTGENVEFVRVDHPFVFHVVLNAPNCPGLVVLFSGRLANPQAA